MAVFNSYVKLPEGTICELEHHHFLCKNHLQIDLISHSYVMVYSTISQNIPYKPKSMHIYIKVHYIYYIIYIDRYLLYIYTILYLLYIYISIIYILYIYIYYTYTIYIHYIYIYTAYKLLK